MRQIIASCLLTCVVVPCSWSSGVSPYLPLNLSPEIERQIERVLVLADKPVMSRPIAAATVLDALPAACSVDEILCQQVQRYLDRYAEYLGLGHASIEVAASDGATTLANARGQSSNSAWRVSLQAYWQPSPYAIMSLGSVAYADEVSASGSMLSLGFEYAQLDVGYREHWLSPFTYSAMLIGTQAKTLPSATLSNYSPITKLGLHYALFLAEMGHSDRIRYSGGYTAGKPRLAGTYLAIEPAGTGWSLAANRVMEFGGGARGGRSFEDFINALYDPQEFDARNNATLDEEFGNQAAAWTSRLIFPGKTPFAVYLEYAGEDRSWEGNYRFGNSALSIGIDVPKLLHRFNLTYEVSEWQNSWYVHSIYRDGLTNDGHALGHWGADARRFGDGVGAQAHMLRIGWEPAFGGLLQLRTRTIANEDYGSTEYERGYDLELTYSRMMGGYTAGTALLVGRDVFGDGFGRLSGFVRFEGDWAAASSPWPDNRSRAPGSDIFIDAGINANRVRVIVDEVVPRTKTDLEIAPHIGVGLRRAASNRVDLGVRAEIDSIDGHLLFAVRALDLRYRLGNALALSAFLGAARYQVGIPAYGYYGGLGVQWRNIFPRVDLNLDARYADKVSRDKLLPGDPVKLVRNDIFYDISSISTYLSYKW